MKTMQATVLASLLLASATGVQAQQQYEILGGDKGTACEAILCLAAGGSAPGECARALRRYYSIWDIRPSKMLKKRLNFLNMCPNADASIVQSLATNRCNPRFQNCYVPPEPEFEEAPEIGDPKKPKKPGDKPRYSEQF